MSNRHQAIAESRSFPVALLLAVGTLVPSVVEAANIIGSQIAETKSYPATARLIVDTPSGFDANNLAQPFLFDGTNLVEFNVTGTIKIRQSAPAASINDTFSGIFNAPPGLKAIAQEYVGITGIAIDNPVVASMQLGDGGDDGMDSTSGNLPRSFFSTGGAVELGPDGSLANAFMNLFMQIDVATTFSVPLGLQALGLDPSYSVGLLYNKDLPLHLEAQIGAYQPFGVPFLIPGGSPTVEMFMAADNPFVLDFQSSSLMRPATPLRAAIFTFADIRITPEPSGALMAVVGAAAIAGVRRRVTAGKLQTGRGGPRR